MKHGRALRLHPFLLWALCLFSAEGLLAAGAEGKNLLLEAQGKTLRWQFEQGDILEIRKTSEQTFVFSESGKKSQPQQIRREVGNRILLTVKEVNAEQGYRLEGSFNSSFRYPGSRAPYEAEEKFASSFYLQPRGIMKVPADTYMPNLRHIPSFPEKNDPSAGMEAGEEWELPGMELLKFGSLLSVPFQVHYEYQGKERVTTADGPKTLHKILLNYQLAHQLPGEPQKGIPRQMMGYVAQYILWDEESGIPYISTEDYNVLIEFPGGVTQEIRAKGKTFYRKISSLSSEQKAGFKRRLDDKISSLPVDKRPEVRVTERGVLISLPDVLFNVNSARLTEESRQVLRQISEVVAAYHDRHFLVRGHSDNTGKLEYNLKLSAERARAVTEYILGTSALPVESISYEGVGMAEPVADNKTEEGRKRNRRVELILLEK